MTQQMDMLAAPPIEAARPIGAIEGPPGWREGFGAGLRVWLGPSIGWRALGDVVTQAAVPTHQHGRFLIGITFDCGAHRFPRRTEAANG